MAVPDRNSKVTDFYFKVHMDSSKFLLSIDDEISPASHLLPLLNACKLSREVVYDQLKHIGLSTPDPHGVMRGYHEEPPIHHFWVNDRRLVQTYIDPVRDILMLNMPDLVLLNHYGRSINLSKVERVAITTFPTYVNRLVRRRMRKYDVLLASLPKRCPDIKVLQIVSRFSVNDFAANYRLCKRRGYHMIDIDTEMWYDDYWDDSGCLVERCHMNRIKVVLEHVKIERTDYQRYLKDLQAMKNRKKFEFWNKVKVTIASLCELDVDSNWETLGKKAPEPRLYCFSFEAWIPAHEDGSLLNKYKGLAQIFEGAPW
ncbi:uncharacterized protein EAE97_007953 [Botrytis byssoidea]|uniref:Uncharacterized protein n=1 Tax=Botrytis byssoidea TaxID=139641 RepID=A0A9P5IE92_9HELO|nr:uncharacterized protein EAE97_007953 [Botrytis byssoidea]KAF7936587.1 hypothetical protein EAE97_007953 [Botrytis byssoidea]